jgi:hypothetical protein
MAHLLVNPPTHQQPQPIYKQFCQMKGRTKNALKNHQTLSFITTTFSPSYKKAQNHVVLEKGKLNIKIKR